MKLTLKQWLLLGIMIFLFGEFFISGMDQRLTFEGLKESRYTLEGYVDSMPFVAVVVFSLIYIVAVSLSIPIATPLTVLAGFLFGSLFGTLLVTVIATIGATIIFLIVRYIFRDTFEHYASNRLKTIGREVGTNGFQDLLILRLMPLVPFSLLNVIFAFTSITVRKYAGATALGIIPFVFVYTHAGGHLADIRSIGDIVSIQTLGAISLIVLSLTLPFFYKQWKHIERAEKES